MESEKTLKNLVLEFQEFKDELQEHQVRQSNALKPLISATDVRNRIFDLRSQFDVEFDKLSDENAKLKKLIQEHTT